MSVPFAGRPLRLGLLGAGMIATVDYGYLPGLAKIRERVSVVAVAGRTEDRARVVAEAYGIPGVYASLDEMLQADIDAVLNLTPIPAHFETSRAILESGRHLVTEKPIASTVAEADALVRLANERDLLIVSAPAEMVTDEWAAARDLVSEGVIGKVAFARIQSSHAGPAGLAWPIDPTSLYQEGAGPLLDMGVYGLHQATGVLGPAKRVMAMSGITTPVRTARGGPFDGLEIPVTVPDNNLLMLDFGESTFAVVDGTFNVVASRSPRMEIYGLGGTLLVNDPDGEAPLLELYRLEADAGTPGWTAPPTDGHADNPGRFAELQRGVLVEHLADCLRDGTRPVLSAEHARHVLEIMIAARASAQEAVAVELKTTF